MMKDAPTSKRRRVALPGSPAPPPENPSTPIAAKSAAAKAQPSAALQKLREIMWKYVGIMRSGPELAAALEQLKTIPLPECSKASRPDQELRNLHTLAQLITRSAVAREESRGSHYRLDFPYRNDEYFAKHSAVARAKEVTFEA